MRLMHSLKKGTYIPPFLRGAGGIGQIPISIEAGGHCPYEKTMFLGLLDRCSSIILPQVERERIQKNNPLSSTQGKSQEVANHSKYQ